MDELEAIERSMADRCLACDGTGSNLLTTNIVCYRCQGSGLERDVQRVQDDEFDTSAILINWTFYDRIDK